MVEKKEISDTLPSPATSPSQKGGSELPPAPENAEAYKLTARSISVKGANRICRLKVLPQGPSLKRMW